MRVEAKVGHDVRFLEGRPSAEARPHPSPSRESDLGPRVDDLSRRSRHWLERRQHGAPSPASDIEGRNLLAETETLLSEAGRGPEAERLERLRAHLERASTPGASRGAVPPFRRPSLGADLVRHRLQEGFEKTPAAGAEEQSPAPTSLLTEQLGDGEANCIERATKQARQGADEILFMHDRANLDGDDAGHALVRDRASGRIWDPNDGVPPADPRQWTYESVDDWVARQGPAPDGGPKFSLDAAIPAERVRDVLDIPPAARAGYIATLGDPALEKVAGRMYAQPDRPEDPASSETLAILDRYGRRGTPIRETILSSPTLRPRDVERAADAGTLTQFDRHPGSSFLGAVGEARVIDSIRDRNHIPFVPSVAISNPTAGDLPDWARGAIGENMPDILAVETGARVRIRGIPITMSVTMRDTIGPGTRGRVGTVNFGPSVLTSLREVTTSNRIDHIEERADRVARWARALPRARRGARAQAIAVLDMDRATYFQLLRDHPQRMQALIQRVTRAGGYIQLHRDLTPESVETARNIARDIRSR